MELVDIVHEQLSHTSSRERMAQRNKMRVFGERINHHKNAIH
jgi:hypothetical protein